MNIDNILGDILSASANVETVRNQLYQVEKIALPSPKEGFNAPTNAFGVYKSTGGASLSVMGKDFVPTQPIDFLDNILYSVHECGANLDLESLKFKEFDGGKKIEFSIGLPDLGFTNSAGNYDETANRMTFSTSYDGSKSNAISLYTFRQICTNGMMGWGMQNLLKGKNTVGGREKILSYCNELNALILEVKAHNDRMRMMDKKEMTVFDVQKFILDLQGYNRKSLAGSDKAETKKLNILDKLEEAIAVEFQRTGATAYGLLNGVSYYTNHIANPPKGVSTEEFIRFNNGLKLNDSAQKLTLAML